MLEKISLNKEEKETFEDLKKYYKCVFKCSSCNKLYGCVGEDNTNLCPICFYKIINAKGIKTRKINKTKLKQEV